MPPLARWLMVIGWVVGFGIVVLNGWAEARHVLPPVERWQGYIAQVAGLLLWGIAFIMTGARLHHREPRFPLYTQSWLWFGLLFLAVLPVAAMQVLHERGVAPEGLVEGAILLGSLIACLLCLTLGVYFWWKERGTV